MFEKRALTAQVESLEAENQELRAEMVRIKNTTTYQLATDLEQEINEIVASGDIDAMGISSAEDEAVARMREKALRERTREIVKKRAEDQIEQQKQQIEAEASAAADQLAAEALQTYLDKQAPAYRKQVIGRLARTAGAKLIITAQKAIDAEEAERAGTPITATETADSPSKSPTTTQRTHEIRAHTKKTDILPYDLLQPGDLITIGFTQAGNGHEPINISSGSNWGGSYRYNSYYEERKLRCRLIDPSLSLFEVESDSWFKDEETRASGLRGGRQILLTSLNPDTNQPANMLVKAAPVIIDAVEGQQPANTEYEVWWVNLDNSKILS